MGESEEAGRRTLSSHGPENPEEKEIALSLRKWWNRNKMKHRILCLAGTRGAPLSCERLDVPAKVLIQPGAEQVWRT